jgi:hypothetical protein
MRYQPAEKTYVTSYWKGHQGFIAIIGSLVVLSVFMLIVGATAAQAQTGQDPRCDGFTRQPFGLCVAAVSEGCIDSVESDACDDLTTNWTTHCSRCGGTPPWTAACTPGAPGCGWSDGDLVTDSQDAWGSNPTPTNAAGLLLTNYDAVYASTFGVVEVGIPGTAGFSIRFSNANDLLGYLPALGLIGPLTSDHIDPSSTESGGFGGEVLALRINVDFSDAGVTLGASGIPFGNLTLCNLTTPPLLNGLTVRQYLGEANTLLGGGSTSHSIAELHPFTDQLNRSFPAGVASLFAQDHLVNGACP